MIKREIITISILSVALLYFLYWNAKNNFPTIYQVALTIAYISVIFFKIIKIKKLKNNNDVK